MGVSSDSQVVQDWLGSFNAAIESRSTAALEQLFLPDSFWRNVLALDWGINTVVGAAKISAELVSKGTTVQLQNVQLDNNAIVPRQVTRAGNSTLEAFIVFETKVGRGSGVLRLCRESTGSDSVRAWTLLTALSELKGFEEAVGSNRPTGQVHSRDFRGPNWLDRRNDTASFDDREPAVLVVGGGQAGLSIAARLTQLGVDTLVVDKNAQVGDNWRNRYHALTLHNQVHANHLPYMPFPPNWPVYIPKDKLANWFEAYAEAMELNIWTSTSLLEGAYNDEEQCWSATVLLSDGSKRVLNPRHIVMATSVSGIPNLPKVANLEHYKGEVMHASAYRDGEDHQGKSAVVLGVGTSGHDIAQDLASSGAEVTMVQRGTTMIISIEPGAQLPYSLYHEGPSLEECDLIATAMPLPLMRKAHKGFTAEARRQDKPLLDKLEQRGMKLDYGPDDTGWQFKYLTRGGGYYFNVGASEMIADGRIGLIQFSDIQTFSAQGIELNDGRFIAADLIVLATGYRGMEAMVMDLFGADVAQRVGPIWGFDEGGLELRNMYCSTAQTGLWFMAGSFAQSRINSKYLALQIKAFEEDLIQGVSD